MNEYVVNMITVRQIRRLLANPKNLARDSTVPGPFKTRALPGGPHRKPLPSEGGPSTTSELDSTRKPKPESDPVPPPDLITVDNYCFPVLETINQPSSIAARLFQKKLDDTDTGSMDPADCFGVQNPRYKSPTTVAPQNNQSNTTGNVAEFANCNQFPDQQRSSQRGSPPSRRIPVHTFSSRKTGQKWRISVSNKPKSPQSVPSERDIQNGESQQSSVNPTSGRFHDENGLKRRILCSTNLSSSQKISEVPVRKGDLRVPVPSLWPGTAPRAFTKLLKSIVAVIRSKGIRIV